MNRELRNAPGDPLGDVPGDAPGDALHIELGGSARVLFSGRADGNASSVGGPHREQGAHVRERLRRRAGVRALARGYQVHGAEVRRVLTVPDPEADEARLRERADGQATALREVGAMVLSADCLPVAIAGESAVAMLHAGWRGLAAGVLEEGVRALRELDPDAELRALIGPGARACCYEVGPEVHDALGRSRGDARAGAPGRENVDLPAHARERLLGAGVREVEDLGLCTICDERFFSHRREGERAGRQAAIAWLS